MGKLKKSNAEVKAGGKFSGSRVVRAASGLKLKFKKGNDAVLKYIGFKDITDKCKNQKAGKKAIIHKFTDGLNTVSVNEIFALSEVSLMEGYYYYLEHKGVIETKQNPMEDIQVEELGKEGDIIPTSLDSSGKATLNLETIKEWNHGGSMRYPLMEESEE